MTRTLQADGLRIVTADDHALAYLPCSEAFWTEAQYLQLTAHCNRLAEFTDGRIEMLPVPTEHHQNIIAFLYLALVDFLRPLGGKVVFAPLRLRLRAGKFREPDLLVLVDGKDERRQDGYWLGADLVMEVVGPDRPRRDTHEKRLDYAAAGIDQYWIVNPIDDSITVLTLADGHYVEQGAFSRGEQAISSRLKGFSVLVGDVFDAD